MKILFLTQYYPPETGAPQNRLHDLAKRLTKSGHHVHVLTALPNYPNSKIYPGYESRFICQEKIDDVEVTRLWLFVPQSRRIILRLINYLSFAAHSIMRVFQIRKFQPDILFMESPPIFLALAGIFLSRMSGARLITNISDLWPKSLVDAGFISRGIGVQCLERLELMMYQASSAITGQTMGILEFIQNLLPAHSLHLYPNGMDLDSVSILSSKEREEIRSKYSWRSDDLIIGYTGVLGYAQALDQILDAARILPKTSRVRLVLFGDGPEKDRLNKQLLSEPGIPIQLCGHLSRSEILKIQQAFDVAIAPLSRADIFKGARPSKLFEYFAASRPCLYCGTGEGADLLNLDGRKAGISVEPECPKELVRAALELEENPALRKKMGEDAYWIVRTYFDRAAIASDLEEFFKRTIALSPRPSLSKRLFDIGTSLVGMILLSPLFLVMSILIKCDSRGPVFYLQSRVGLNGHIFKLIKFRTMYANSDVSGQLTQGTKDPRVTRLGSMLRKYRIDEFPQLFNVFRGDMSFVGPRPEVPKFVEHYTELERQTLRIRPGITDFAAIEFLDKEEEILAANPDRTEEVYIKQILPLKLAVNQKHLSDQPSLKSDIRFIIKTLMTTFHVTKRSQN